MFNFSKTIRGVVKLKNAQIRAEREKSAAQREANKILSAYIVLLASGQDGIRILKKDVGMALGRYIAEISHDGDYYMIRVRENTGRCPGKRDSCGTK